MGQCTPSASNPEGAKFDSSENGSPFLKKNMGLAITAKQLNAELSRSRLSLSGGEPRSNRNSQLHSKQRCWRPLAPAIRWAPWSFYMSYFFHAWFNALACSGAILKDHDENLNKRKNSKNDGEPKNALREPSKVDCVLHEPVRLLRQCFGMLNKLGRLLQKPISSFLRLLSANLVINCRLKMNGIRNAILNKNNTTGTHRAEVGKVVIRQLARSQISEGSTDVHNARKMPNDANQ